MDISKIDSNFVINASFDTSVLDIYDILEKPFQIHGLIPPKDKTEVFTRLPLSVAQTVSEKVAMLHAHTSGGRVRFKTNSSSVAIFAKMRGIGRMPHFAFTGSAGFDMYVNGKFFKTEFAPPTGGMGGYSAIKVIGNREEKSIEINFPLYSEVFELLIGLDTGATLSAPDSYRYDTPVVYYGSSITQGACASRPGNIYQAVISRRFNVDFWNFGFSGAARAEKAIVDYISDQKMKIFVMDYDHNAPNPDYLEKTHKPMFDAIRAKHPSLPIVLVTRPIFHVDRDTELRAAVVRKTYETALDDGDKNVYFVDGVKTMHLFGDDNDGPLVDAWHPNDFGFALMAKAIGDVIGEIINKFETEKK